jgi:hypothetical protein
MKSATETFRARLTLAGLVLLASAFLWTAFGDTAGAQTSPQVVRVEEDWELVVATPDANSAAPQVSCLISPVGNTESVHAAFEMNYQSMPEFLPGGLQLRIWNNESPLVSRKFPNGAVMQQAGETVRWTQNMSLGGGLLSFEITGGSSTSWGSFGGQGYLKATVATSLENLNAYSPSVSTDNSGVGYAANRVQSLTLRKVRLVTSAGQVLETEPLCSVYPKQ